jgi:hypothetical protein
MTLAASFCRHGFGFVNGIPHRSILSRPFAPAFGRYRFRSTLAAAFSDHIPGIA